LRVLAAPVVVRVRWTGLAVLQLAAIGEHIAERNPTAARGIERRLRGVVEALTHFPKTGHEGRLPGTRELTVPGTPDVIAYRLAGDFIDILAIFHGAQRRDLP
jgi:toxin ParE1/3/4